MEQKTQQAASDNPTDQDRADSVACARCGAIGEGPPLTWTCSVEGGVRRYFCDACGRTHLRSIEGRLDSAWW